MVYRPDDFSTASEIFDRMADHRRVLLVLGVVGVAVLAAAGVFLLDPFAGGNAGDSPTDTAGNDTDPQPDVEALEALPGEGIPPDFADAYEIEEMITVEGEDEPFTTTFVVDGDRVLEDGSWFADTAFTSYYRTDEDWVATRQTTTDAEIYEDWNDSRDEDEIVDREEGAGHDGDGTYTLVTARETETTVEERFEFFYAEIGAGYVLSNLNYDERGQTTYEGRTVDVLEPRAGVYDRHPDFDTDWTHVVTEADGELYLDADTGATLYADVTYTIIDASSLWEYAAALAEDDETTIEVSYAVSEIDGIDRPEWVEEPA